MISMKNSVYVEVFGDTAGGRLLRLNNVQWRRVKPVRTPVAILSYLGCVSMCRQAAIG